ncbi:hypothetical protein RN01_07230 [Cupriavidus sp. SHE]|jgi:hypothetical protein|nr:hypothetical protein RN01_07230 [Cupriavidus sp. SHE]
MPKSIGLEDQIGMDRKARGFPEPLASGSDFSMNLQPDLPPQRIKVLANRRLALETSPGT